MWTAGRNWRHSPASERTPKTAPTNPASTRKSNQPTRRKRSRNAVACPQTSFGCIAWWVSPDRLGDETIADPRLGDQILWIGRIGLDLATQRADMHAHRVVRRSRRTFPNDCDDLVEC